MTTFFDECAAKCVHLIPQEEECTSFSLGESKMYTPDTIANSKKTPTKINKNDAIANRGVACGCVCVCVCVWEGGGVWVLYTPPSFRKMVG